jgi:hypothetical protein
MVWVSGKVSSERILVLLFRQVQHCFHISLYHAAAVVWAYAGTHDTTSDASLDMGEARGKSGRDEYRIHRGNNAGLMSNFAALLKKITPAWITISSFMNSLSIMAGRPFPMLPALDKR